MWHCVIWKYYQRTSKRMLKYYRISKCVGFLQITALLPRLEQEDYYMSPSPAQLAAMARSEPGSLMHVANFTIGRQRMGKIRWIDPVDVRRLDIDGTIRFSKDTCEVMPVITLKVWLHSCNRHILGLDSSLMKRSDAQMVQLQIHSCIHSYVKWSSARI